MSSKGRAGVKCKEIEEQRESALATYSSQLVPSLTSGGSGS